MFNFKPPVFPTGLKKVPSLDGDSLFFEIQFSDLTYILFTYRHTNKIYEKLKSESPASLYIVTFPIFVKEKDNRKCPIPAIILFYIRCMCTLAFNYIL